MMNSITVHNSIIIVSMLLVLAGLVLNIGKKRTDRQNLVGAVLLIIGSFGILCFT